MECGCLCNGVCSWRPGPDWIAGTVKEVLGPVTYIVETDDGHRWKRHADQIKSWIESVSPGVPSSAESAEVLPSVPATSAELLPGRGVRRGGIQGVQVNPLFSFLKINYIHSMS